MSIKRRIIKRNRKYLMKQGEIVGEFKTFSLRDKYCLQYKDSDSFISVRENSKYEAYKEAVNSLKYFPTLFFTLFFLLKIT